MLTRAVYPKVFEEYKQFTEKYGDLSVIPTRYFLGKPKIGDEMSIEIDKGVTLRAWALRHRQLTGAVVKLLAVGTVSSDGTRECFFELSASLRSADLH